MPDKYLYPNENKMMIPFQTTVDFVNIVDNVYPNWEWEKNPVLDSNTTLIKIIKVNLPFIGFILMNLITLMFYDPNWMNFFVFGIFIVIGYLVFIFVALYITINITHSPSFLENDDFSIVQPNYLLHQIGSILLIYCILLFFSQSYFGFIVALIATYGIRKVDIINKNEILRNSPLIQVDLSHSKFEFYLIKSQFMICTIKILNGKNNFISTALIKKLLDDGYSNDEILHILMTKIKIEKQSMTTKYSSPRYQYYMVSIIISIIFTFILSSSAMKLTSEQVLKISTYIVFLIIPVIIVINRLSIYSYFKNYKSKIHKLVSSSHDDETTLSNFIISELDLYHFENTKRQHNNRLINVYQHLLEPNEKIDFLFTVLGHQIKSLNS